MLNLSCLYGMLVDTISVGLLFAVAVDGIQKPRATRFEAASVDRVLAGIGESLLGKGRTVCLMTVW